VCVHVCVYACECICMHVCLCACVCMYVCLGVCVCMYVCLCVAKKYLFSDFGTDIHIVDVTLCMMM